MVSWGKYAEDFVCVILSFLAIERYRPNELDLIAGNFSIHGISNGPAAISLRSLMPVCPSCFRIAGDDHNAIVGQLEV